MNVLVPTFALLTLSGSPSSEEVPLRFAPEADAVATKRFQRTMELSGGELSVVMNGQEVPAQFLPELAIDVTHAAVVTIRDRYVRTADGRPQELERTFERVDFEHSEASQMLMEGMDTSSESAANGTSPLEGEELHFHWDADEETYEIRFAEREDGNAGLLEGLVEDTDLRAWLPPGAVESGASWTVPADAFAALWSPGGDLGLEFDGDREGLVPDSTEYSGELELKLVGVFGDDGERVAVMDVAGELTVTTVAPTTLDDVPVVDGPGVQTTAYGLTLEGEFRWSLSAGRLAGLELEADVQADVTLEADPSSTVEFTSTVKMSGTSAYRIEVE